VGRDGDQATAQGGAAGDGVVAAGDGSGGGSPTRLVDQPRKTSLLSQFHDRNPTGSRHQIALTRAAGLTLRLL